MSYKPSRFSCRRVKLKLYASLGTISTFVNRSFYEMQTKQPQVNNLTEGPVHKTPSMTYIN